MEKILEQLIVQQEDKMYKLAKRIIPHITKEDLLQPNDFIELENHPIFRYEEGVLKGLHAARMALISEIRNF